MKYILLKQRFFITSIASTTYLKFTFTDCSSPGYIVHGMIEGQSFKQGGKMKYSCIKGYKLNGENDATCMKYG